MSGCQEVRSVFCDICQQIILGDTLKRHISYKHIQDRQTKCQLCSKDFVGKEHLKSHMIQHSDSRDFKCDLCEKRFNRKASLTSHLRTHREEGGQFQCKLCPKVSNKPISKSHMAQHINEHPLECSSCGKSFKNSISLNRHQRNVHRADSLPCTQCTIGRGLETKSWNIKT